MTAPARQQRCEHGFLDAARICPSCSRSVAVGLHRQLNGAKIPSGHRKCERCLRLKPDKLLRRRGTHWRCAEPCSRIRDGFIVNRTKPEAGNE